MHQDNQELIYNKILKNKLMGFVSHTFTMTVKYV